MPSLDRPRLAVYVAAVIAIAFVGARYLHHPASGSASSGDSGFASDSGGSGSPGGSGDVAGGGAAGASAGGSDAGTGDAASGGASGAGSLATPALVDVVGAVRRPGVYRLAGGSRVADAVRRAGGATQRAELTGVNLAARLVDGTQIVVPRRGTPGAVPAASGAAPSGGAGSPAAPAAPAAPVNLNTATETELEALDGVGPATAQKIIAYREEHGGFRSVDELDEVSGIGPRKLELLRPQVTL